MPATAVRRLFVLLCGFEIIPRSGSLRAEWEHATSGRPAASWVPEDYDLPGLDWELIEGDREIMPA